MGACWWLHGMVDMRLLGWVNVFHSLVVQTWVSGVLIGWQGGLTAGQASCIIGSEWQTSVCFPIDVGCRLLNCPAACWQATCS